jgi:tetratricopeptide (TPR) repeat protein
MSAQSQELPITHEERRAQASWLHRLGVLRARSARYDEAAELLGQALELVPKSPIAHSNLGITLRALGRLDEAVACYHRALDLAPQYAAGHYNLGNALLRLGRADEAVVAYHTALGLEPEFVEAYNNLGVALAQLGRDEAAMAVYDRAASLQQSGFENPLANKALLLLETGRAAQSAAAIDQALVINPDSAAAWHMRCGLKKFTRGDPDIAAMEALLAGLSAPQTATSQTSTPRIFTPSGPNFESRICLQFALGKAWMDVGDADRAFAHLDEGNRLKRSTFAYDSTATDRWIAEMAGSFTPELMQRLGASGHPGEVPVLVVGMPRSGTTLVEQILASHPEIHGAGELTLLEDMVARISGQRVDELCPPGDPQQLAALLPDDLARLGREYEAQVCALAPGRRRVVDKMPTNFLYVGFIHAILPNARIIHCRRDAVDTCLSCYTKLFRDVKFASDLRELGLYYRAYENLMGHWRNLMSPERFTEVHYEDVVDDLEGQARRLVRFCGLPWHEACLDFHENGRPVRTASVTQVRQPIYRSSIGRWKPYARHLGRLLEALELKVPSDVV